jgi:hypothetical protein
MQSKDKQIHHKEEVILLSHTGPQPGAMMVELLDTVVANVTVGRPGRPENITGVAVLMLDEKVILDQFWLSFPLEIVKVVEEVDLEIGDVRETKILTLIFGDDAWVSEGYPGHKDKGEYEGYGDKKGYTFGVYLFNLRGGV